MSFLKGGFIAIPKSGGGGSMATYTVPLPSLGLGNHTVQVLKVWYTQLTCSPCLSSSKHHGGLMFLTSHKNQNVSSNTKKFFVLLQSSMYGKGSA